MSLEPLDDTAHGRVTDHVHDKLQDAIFRGDLGPGAHLSVPELARQLGVSRSPVHAAVLKLIGEGLAAGPPRRGARVTGWSNEKLREVYELRQVLEGLAARLAAERMSDEEIERLQESLKEHRRALQVGEMERHVSLDQEFHSRIRAGARNAELDAALAGLRLKVMAAMAMTTVTAGPDRALADHEQIFQAIEARDADRAEAVAVAHIQRLMEALAP